MKSFIGFLSNKLRLRLKPGDLPEGMPSQVHAEFIRQEHRTMRIVTNALSHYHLPDDDPRRGAALEAVLWRLFTSQGVQAASAVGFGLIASVATVYVATRANQIAESQNKISISQTTLLKQQTETQIRQSDLQSAIAESAIAAGFNSEILRAQETIEKEEKLSEATARKIVLLSKALIPHRDHLVQRSPAKDDLVSPERANLLFVCMRSRNSAEANSETYRNMIRNADFTKAQQDSFDMSGMMLERINLSGAKFQDANFSGVNFEEARLTDAEFINCRWPLFGNPENLRTSFNRIHGRNIRFDNSYLLSVDFIEAQLSYASFANTTIRDVNFTGANLLNANFNAVPELIDANLSGAMLPDATMFRNTVVKSINLEDAFTNDENWMKTFLSVIDKNSQLDDWETVKTRAAGLYFIRKK